MQKGNDAVLRTCLAGLPLLGFFWVLSVPQLLDLPLVTQQAVTGLLGLSVAIALLSHPYAPRFPLVDLLLALLGLASWLWYAWNFEGWMVTLAYRTPDMWIPGIFALVLMTEALRKAMGPILAVLVWLIVAYGLWGDHLPGVLEAFWEAAAQKVLKLQYCEDSGRFQHPPRPVSIYTGSRNLSWRAVASRGRIYSHTTIRIKAPGLEGRLPLAAATIELEEGVRMIANVLATEPDRIAVGAQVALIWDEIAPGVLYPAFRVV